MSLQEADCPDIPAARARTLRHHTEPGAGAPPLQGQGLSSSIMSPLVFHALVKPRAGRCTARQAFGGKVVFHRDFVQSRVRGFCTQDPWSHLGTSQQDLGPGIICVMSASGTRINQSLSSTTVPQPCHLLNAQATDLSAPLSPASVRHPTPSPSTHGGSLLPAESATPFRHPPPKYTHSGAQKYPPRDSPRPAERGASGLAASGRHFCGGRAGSQGQARRCSAHRSRGAKAV